MGVIIVLFLHSNLHIIIAISYKCERGSIRCALTMRGERQFLFKLKKHVLSKLFMMAMKLPPIFYSIFLNDQQKL